MLRKNIVAVAGIVTSNVLLHLYHAHSSLYSVIYTRQAVLRTRTVMPKVHIRIISHMVAHVA